jgi:phosphatidate cytidylyltransferase
VADPAPAQLSRPSTPAGENLTLRVWSSLVLAPLAVATAYFGGWPFALFWCAAAIGVFWEWSALVADKNRRPIVMVGAAALALASGLAASGHAVGIFGILGAIAAILVAALGLGAIAPLGPPHHRGWLAGGVPYAGAIGIAPVVLRSDSENGFVAMVFLFAIVWATDIAAFFLGRLIGGPRLLPRVSPKKTWSGAIGGLAAAVLAAVAVAKAAGLSGFIWLALVAAILSCAAQAGDLFESLVKRRFGAKDSSHLIPGHGGLMDRLDGFIFAAAIAALVGLLRGGVAAPARSLLVW